LKHEITVKAESFDEKSLKVNRAARKNLSFFNGDIDRKEA
jgi:hypothetical protein